MPTPAILAARGVSKTFSGVLALDDVTVEIVSGQMVALIGPSGSGKSTLLRCLVGLTRIDRGAGTIEGFGEEVQANGRLISSIRTIRRRVGFVFQQFNLVGRLTLFTNVALGALGAVGFWRGLFGLWPPEIRRAATAAMERVGVAEHAGQRAATLSGGQQQRGAIARALVQAAEVILADEPVASLDPVAAHRVMEILRALNHDDGMTVVVTLHQVEYATRYCDRVIALKDGRVSFDGPASALDRDILSHIYGEQFQDAAGRGAAE